jgi:hypothetical protein
MGDCKKDPAHGRSDHSRFQYHNWAANLVCQNMWDQTCPKGAEKASQIGNPNYHHSTDTDAHVKSDYEADIIATVAAAAWKIATS